jgi:hypothetical protein
METTTENNKDVKTEPIPADARKELESALKTKTARRTFRSVEEVVAEGIKKGEDPNAKPIQDKQIEAKVEIEALPETIDIVVNEETGARTEVFKDANGSEVRTELAEPEKPAIAIEEKQPGPKIKIGAKTFTNQDEAMAYAEELERQVLTDEAFRQGIEAASQIAPSNSNSQVTAATSEPDTVPDIYYTNPAAFLKQRDEQLSARIKAELFAAADKVERDKATWNKFWNDYPDLATSPRTKDLVSTVYQQNFKRLEKVKTDVALKEIATLTRDWMKDLGVTILPTKTLPSTTKPIASSGTSTTVKRPVQEQKPLSWVEEMKNMKQKKAEARRSR